MQTPPACTPKPSPLPTPPFSGGPECPAASDCQPCVENPTCSPPPWPSVAGNEPWMIPISGPTPGDGTHLEWRIFPPGWSYSPATSPSPWPSPQPTPGPAVLLVHGGSWVSGDPFQPQVERVAEIIAQDGFLGFRGRLSAGALRQDSWATAASVCYSHAFWYTHSDARPIGPSAGTDRRHYVFT